MKKLLKNCLRKIWHKIRGKIPNVVRMWSPARKKDIERNDSHLRKITNALVDSKGLGMLELMLYNAHIPNQYYAIFYKMLSHNLANKNLDSMGGGDI